MLSWLSAGRQLYLPLLLGSTSQWWEVTRTTTPLAYVLPWAVHLAWRHPKVLHEQQIAWVAGGEADLCLHSNSIILSAQERARCDSVSLRPACLPVRGPDIRGVG